MMCPNVKSMEETLVNIQIKPFSHYFCFVVQVGYRSRLWNIRVRMNGTLAL